MRLLTAWNTPRWEALVALVSAYVRKMRGIREPDISNDGLAPNCRCIQ